jgi:hypothetical protein
VLLHVTHPRIGGQCLHVQVARPSRRRRRRRFRRLQAIWKLRRTLVEVTLVDRRNFHLFQPLTYQVATGALRPGEIAYRRREIFMRDCNWHGILRHGRLYQLTREHDDSKHARE